MIDHEHRWEPVNGERGVYQCSDPACKAYGRKSGRGNIAAYARGRKPSGRDEHGFDAFKQTTRSSASENQDDSLLPWWAR